MRAWQCTRLASPLQLVDIADPDPRPGEVVVDVRAAGLCHSDVGIVAGDIPGYPPFMPIVLGHEVSGVVSRLGAGVTRCVVGDRVAIHSFGDEDNPTATDYVGTGRNGGYAERTTAWENEIKHLSEGLPFEQAAVATDAGMTSYRAVHRVGQVTEGTRVGIIGLGGLGMTAARIAVLAGAEVYGAEINLEVFPAARAVGVRHCVEDVTALASLDLDVIIDFAGMGTTTAGAIEAVRPGGRVVQVGLGRPEATISTALLTLKQVTLVGSLGGSYSDLSAVIDLMEDGQLEVATVAVAFEEIGEGLERLARGENNGHRLVAVIGAQGGAAAGALGGASG